MLEWMHVCTADNPLALCLARSALLASIAALACNLEQCSGHKKAWCTASMVSTAQHSTAPPVGPVQPLSVVVLPSGAPHASVVVSSHQSAGSWLL